MKRSALAFVAAATAIASLIACNEDTVAGVGFICDVTNPVGSVLITQPGSRIVVHSPALGTDTTVVAAVATNRFGGLRTDVKIQFSSSDTTIATVDSTGTVHAKRPGVINIKASTCGESASTSVTIVANVARVTLSPASDTVLTGDSVTYTAHAFGADDSAVPGTKFTFAGSPSSTATIRQTSDSTAVVVGGGAGSGTITATAEGRSANSTVLVLARAFLAGTVSTSTIDAGDATACGIITLGGAYCWGLNNHGQLGAKADSVCFDDASTAIVNDSAKTTALGCSLKPLSVSPNLSFASISSGDSTACGITLDGRAYCWGAGIHGEIGNGAAGDKGTPVLVTGALTFTSISVGGSHACGIAAGGVAYCWGSDLYGQLGDARQVTSTTPIPVATGAGVMSFASISAGYRHTCGVTTGGVGYCWGDNTFGQLGDGSNALRDAPSPVSGSLTFQFISAGGDHTCGITTGGAAFCWGDNTSGQLGVGSTTGASSAPVAVVGALAFTRISASSGTRTVDPKSALPFKHLGRGHTCGLTSTGAVFCWGDDTDLQLGRGQFTGGNGASGTPQQVALGERPGSATYTSISVGSRHSCGVATDGNAYCWGSNVLGGLGNTLQAAFRGQPQRVATPK